MKFNFNNKQLKSDDELTQEEWIEEMRKVIRKKEKTLLKCYKTLARMEMELEEE